MEAEQQLEDAPCSIGRAFATALEGLASPVDVITDENQIDVEGLRIPGVGAGDEDAFFLEDAREAIEVAVQIADGHALALGQRVRGAIAVGVHSVAGGGTRGHQQDTPTGIASTARALHGRVRTLDWLRNNIADPIAGNKGEHRGRIPRTLALSIYRLEILAYGAARSHYPPPDNAGHRIEQGGPAERVANLFGGLRASEHVLRHSHVVSEEAPPFGRGNRRRTAGRNASRLLGLRAPEDGRAT